MNSSTRQHNYNTQKTELILGGFVLWRKLNVYLFEYFTTGRIKIKQIISNSFKFLYRKQPQAIFRKWCENLCERKDVGIE